MRLLAKNIPVSLDAMLSENTKAFAREVSHALGVKATSIDNLHIERKSVDARRKDNVHYVLNVSFDPLLDKPLDFWEGRAKRGVAVERFSPVPDVVIPRVCDRADRHDEKSDAVANEDAPRPIVVGAGPAGLFCALYLARAGMRPILIERGQAVQERLASVRKFESGGELDPESNIQFGEGGAGTFSDGKLNTGTKSPFNSFVLKEFVAAGAPEDILIDAKPHIGTDYLVHVVSNLRRKIIDAGADVLFSTKLVDVVFDEDADGQTCVSAVVVEDGHGKRSIATNRVILACGHSARDVFSLMDDLGVKMERKPFAVGVRIEHPQALIDAIQYGKFAGHAALGAADYKLAVKTSKGRGVYSFCMCPGGRVVAAASEVGGMCVNGMSDNARDGEAANSAILVEVLPCDFEGDNVLEGVNFQRELESAAFVAGGSNYSAPMQRLGSFLKGKLPNFPAHLKSALPVELASFKKSKSQNKNRADDFGMNPTYPRGCAPVDLKKLLPDFVHESLSEGLLQMDKRMRGFAYEDACLIAVEARSSSPVRIVRDRKSLQSLSVRGLYPTGEGAGYAGGIMSAATDGLRVAERIVCEELLRDDIEKAASALKDSRAVVFPTDTVCGIGMSVAASPDTGYLFKAKGRSETKPLQWLVADASALDEYGCEIKPYVRRLANEFWPGALTLIVKASDAVAKEYAAKDDTIGLRMPDSEVALELIRRSGAPLITTSANRSGEKPASTIEDVDKTWLEGLDAEVVCGFSTKKRKDASSLASTVVDCTGDKPKILREGSISAADIRAVI